MVIPLAGLLLYWFFIKNQPLFSQVQERLGDLNDVLRENLLGVRVVKAFAREPVEMQRYTQMNNNLVAVYLKTLSAIRNTFPFIFLLSNLVTLAVIGFGGAQVIEGRFTIGELVAFNAYLLFIVQPVLLIGFAAPVIAQAGGFG